MQWLHWSRRIQAIAQIGLTYGKDPYDLERYEKLRQLAVEIASAHLSRPPEQVAVVFANGEGYATPKVDVRAVVFHEGKLLLARERAEGLWSLPGGWADVGDSPGESAARETREETGYTVRPTRLLALLDRDRHGHPPMLTYIYKIFIQCELVGGEPVESLETDAVGWFGRNEIPPLSVSRVTEAQIRRLFEHHDNPGLPADFD